MKAIGLDFTLQRVYQYATLSEKFSRSWDEWLKAAGLDPRSINGLKVTHTSTKIINVVQTFYKNSVPLNASSMSNDSSKSSQDLIEAAIGLRRKARYLYAFGLTLKTWDRWLIDAGLDPRLIRSKH